MSEDYNQEMDLPTTGASSGTKVLHRLLRMGTKALQMEHQQVMAAAGTRKTRSSPHSQKLILMLTTSASPYILPEPHCSPKEESSLKKPAGDSRI